MKPFFDRLETARRERHTVLCVGIDPRPAQIPEGIRRAAGGDMERLLTRFGAEILDLVAPFAACVKPQIAFFEAHGLAGLRAYASVLREARGRGIPVIGDVKRGDIGSTAVAYAAAHLEPGADLEADAITLNPYLGADALEPFVRAAQEAGKGLYVLVRTSNPGARDLQELEVAPEGRLLYEHTADLVARLGEGTRVMSGGFGCVGAVVGATAPAAAAALRVLLPDTPFLVPGYGAQGATAQDVAVSRRPDGSGMVVNASRSIIHPPVEGGTWQEAVVAAARRSKEELHEAVTGARG
ncbi:MAG: orotidine-5'-phosphate decarboxylase [Planctomycetota bacterium]